MKYRIDYTDGRYSETVRGREALIDKLKLLKISLVADIYKLYASGISDSVMEKFTKYVPN